MLPVDLLVRAPLGVLRDEGIFTAYYFAFKVCSQAWVIFGQT